MLFVLLFSCFSHESKRLHITNYIPERFDAFDEMSHCNHEFVVIVTVVFGLVSWKQM